jgi:hypothetical protein
VLPLFRASLSSVTSSECATPERKSSLPCSAHLASYISTSTMATIKLCWVNEGDDQERRAASIRTHVSRHYHQRQRQARKANGSYARQPIPIRPKPSIAPFQWSGVPPQQSSQPRKDEPKKRKRKIAGQTNDRSVATKDAPLPLSVQTLSTLSGMAAYYGHCSDFFGHLEYCKQSDIRTQPCKFRVF